MSKCYKEVIKKTDISKQLTLSKEEVKQIIAISLKDYILVGGQKIQHVKDGKTTTIDVEDEILSAFIFNGSYFVSTKDKLFKLTEKETEEVIAYTKEVKYAAATNDRIIVAYADKDVIVYDEDYAEYKTLEIGTVFKVVCSGHHALLLKEKGIEIVNGSNLDSLSQHYFTDGKVKIYGELSTASIGTDAQYICIGYKNGRISTLIEDGKQFSFYAHCDRKADIFYQIDALNYYKESILFSGAKDGEINVWNLERKDILCSIAIGNEIISSTIVEKHFVFVVKEGTKYTVKQIEIEPLLEEVNVTGVIEPEPIVTSFGGVFTPKIRKPRAKKEKKEKPEPKRRKPRKKFEDGSEEVVEEEVSEEEIVSFKKRGKKEKKIENYSLSGKGTFGVKVYLHGYTEIDENRTKESMRRCGYFGLTTNIKNATIVVSKSGARNVEILTAILNNIPIVNHKWMVDSIKKKTQQPYEIYLWKNKYPALEVGKVETELLKDKSISIYGELKIDQQIVREMIETLGGTFGTRNKYSSIVLVGKTNHHSDATLRTEGYAVTETWLYDCISDMQCHSVKKYLVDGALKTEKEKECELTTPKIVSRHSEIYARNVKYEEYLATKKKGGVKEEKEEKEEKMEEEK